jgi:3-methyladenine DNA glycosylase AlkD
MITAKVIIDELRLLGKPENIAGMQRFGVYINTALGVSMPTLRKVARPYRWNHALALDLWQSGIHEARILASLIDDPAQVTEEQMEAWVNEFNSWDLCDQTCSNLFNKTPFAYAKALDWSTQEAEFVRRAGFVLMAMLAVHDKKATDAVFLPFFARMETYAFDNRNFVKKAINWALRQVGKRNATLHPQAIVVAGQISQQPHKSAKWIAADALRELQGHQVKARISGTPGKQAS